MPLMLCALLLELNKLIQRLDSRGNRNVFKKTRVESTWSESRPPPGAPSWAVSSRLNQIDTSESIVCIVVK